LFGLSGGDLLYIDISNYENPRAVHHRESNGLQAFISGIVGNANMDGINVMAVEGIDFGDEAKKVPLAVSISSSGILRLWNINIGQIISTTYTWQFLHLSDSNSSFLDGKFVITKTLNIKFDVICSP